MNRVRIQRIYRGSMTLLVAVFFVICGVQLKAQEKTSDRTILAKDGRMEITYLNKPAKESTKDTLYYYWHYANQVKITQGGYDGNLLNGWYTKFYRNNNLMEKGRFKDGLKSGDWKSWNEDGQILVHEAWKKGLRSGIQKVYEDGKLVEKNSYLKGLRNGTCVEYGRDNEKKIMNYKMGAPRVPKGDRTKKLDSIPLEEKNPKSSNGDDSKKLRKKAEREKKKTARKLSSDERKKAKDRSAVKSKKKKEIKVRNKK